MNIPAAYDVSFYSIQWYHISEKIVSPKRINKALHSGKCRYRANKINQEAWFFRTLYDLNNSTLIMRVVLCALMYYANIRAKLMCVILPMLAFDK